MKKLIVAMVALMAVASLLVSAMAYPMYVAKDPGKVYKKDSKKSDVISRLPFGGGVDVIEEKGDWAHINYVNKNGVQKSGWMLFDSLSDKKPHKHDWSSWKVTKEATCEKAGEKTRTCSGCGKKETKTIEKLDHEWGKWKVTKEATCVKKGERARKCKNCGKKQTESYMADHEYGSWSLTKDPTCTEKGERVRTCRVCGRKDRQALDKLPHEYQWRIITEPTDHSAGIRARICTVCGHDGGESSFDPAGTLRRKDRSEEVYKMQQLLVEQGYLNAGGADGVFGGGTEKALKQYQQDRGLNPDGIAWPQTLDDLQHDFGPWETVKEMTRTEAGERVRKCRGCGFEQHERIESGEVFEIKRRGEDIRAMQQMLTALGYSAGGYDGIYGKKLDAAMKNFARARGLTVEQGMIRPADVDAVMNAWLDSLSAESWKGEGDESSPVNLALTVTEMGKADDSGITHYTWSLTNLGSEKATYVALLLTFGEAPDFMHDNLVMNLDGVTLKPGSGNSISGAFSADADWGEGDMHFAALAVSEVDGAKWLSNDVIFENTSSASSRTIAPIANAADVNKLPDGTYPVSFDRGDVLGGASGIFMNAVKIYAQDQYAAQDVEALKQGDIIIAEGEEVPVQSVEKTEYGISVNAGQEDEFYLSKEEDSDVYAIHGLDDLTTFTMIGMTALTIDPSATFTDAWDIEKDPVATAYEGIVEAMQTTENEYFVPYNTTVRIEGGKVAEINRVYVP